MFGRQPEDEEASLFDHCRVQRTRRQEVKEVSFDGLDVAGDARRLLKKALLFAALLGRRVFLQASHLSKFQYHPGD